MNTETTYRIKPLYYLSESGRMPVRLKGTKQECQAEVRRIAREELELAKRRFGKAYLHSHGNDSYLITLAPDRRSSMWTSLALVEV